jgi:alanyl-tRNA synthetase
MKTDEIREKYLDFFKSKGHTVCASDVLVPKWDKSVLFTPAGMNPFKDHFLGKVKLEFTRATSCQKCLRTGDIENVGRTAYHHTFFEMLGNFSFGDYFKREAIIWAWEFLTDKQWLGIDPDRLTVSVYLDDDEAAGIWHTDVGLSLDRIARMGEHDNFWPAGAPTEGPDGVCGPCSEIFFHADDAPECEIWNLVFTQFNRVGDPPDNLHPLPSKNIDTGMGLERIAATLQGKSTNYHIDTLLPICEAAADVCGRKYEPDTENGRRFRRITDHIRACTLAIHENVYPGSQKEEYVIRRLLRRAVLQGHEMGLREPFLYKLVPAVVDQMSHPYPDLKDTVDRVAQVIENEEAGFLATLDDGLDRIEKIFAHMKAENSTLVDGHAAAELYQTFGIPAELFASMASDRNCEFDWDGYNAAMQQHAIESGKIADTVMGDFGPIDDIKREVKSTEFLGYEAVEARAMVRGLIVATSQGETTRQDRVARLEIPLDHQTQMLILDRTPFYGESGGQVGDTGVIVGKNGMFNVTDTQKNGDVFVHLGKMVQGRISEDEEVTATVDVHRRNGIRRAHSATHILHYALQQNVGSHAQQRGSKVAADWLRFDFSNMSAVTPEQLAKVEQVANERVSENAPISATTVPLDDARKAGAMMLFGEKYPDPVRMISMGDFSKELCGGTHLDSTGQIEAFEILGEESVSSGTRRVIAVTGQKAKENQQKVQLAADRIARELDVAIVDIPAGLERLTRKLKDLKKQISSGKKSERHEEPLLSQNKRSAAPTYFEVRDIMRQISAQLNVPVVDLPDRVESLAAEVDSLTKQLDELSNIPSVDADGLIATGEMISDILVIVQELRGANSGMMRQLIDQVRKKRQPAAVFLATAEAADKVIMVAGITRDLVDKGLSAGEWVKQVAPVIGGRGGGKPDLAQAGGKHPENLKQALREAAEFMKSNVVS